MSVLVLGPYVDNVIEPDPTTTPTAPATPGRQQIIFDDPATAPGGQVFLKLVPPSAPGDAPPINIHIFHVPTPLVPALADRTPEWFLTSVHPTNHVNAGTAGADGKLKVVVAGVKPSLVAYHVQSVIEYER